MENQRYDQMTQSLIWILEIIRITGSFLLMPFAPHGRRFVVAVVAPNVQTFTTQKL